MSARLRVVVRGAVQGVGFRPFVFRLATELRLGGFVHNSTQGVLIEVEGPPGALNDFLLRLERERPPRSFIQSLEPSWLDAAGGDRFEIRASTEAGAKTALVLPDIAACPDCVREIFDPANRRFRYPFTNCTHCGPRFSIIEALPYDRANTSMREFTMCPACDAEYHDPAHRRFHAQPNACPHCGPHLELWDAAGGTLAVRDEALRACAEAIRAGRIVAVKGLGGFHLFVAATNESAVQRLRARKHREEKPLALMFPTIASVRACCEVSELEERLLCSPEAPIVLLRRPASERGCPRPQQPESVETRTQSNASREVLLTAAGDGRAPLASSIAPGNPGLGVMLPCTPLHHLLLAELQGPVVATSGNLSDEPICTGERAALDRLRGIADLFLIHNRRIVRHVDDSIVRVILGREMVLRRARGYAPLPVQVRNTERGARSVLAVGAHLKNTVALSVGDQVFISQHLGDLETAPAFDAFQRVAADLPRLYETHPAAIAADAHPDYLSTQFARAQPAPVVAVQHHYAHVLACMAENELSAPVLGVAWDGTGLGTDGTIWGGEFLLVNERGFERVASLRPFRLPGGDTAMREPRRAALGLLHALGEEWPEAPTLRAFSGGERTVLVNMLDRGLNSPFTSSAGRLFDAVASLTGLRQISRFEGQAAMELEFAADECDTDERYESTLMASPAWPSPSLLLDWAPMISAILRDRREAAVPEIAARFHNALAAVIVAVAERVGCERVALSGGCFQNRRLTERAVTQLQRAGFRVYWHQRVPPNDGGIALGQVLAAWRNGTSTATASGFGRAANGRA